MADLEKTVQIIFEGSDRVSGLINGMQSKMSGMASNVADITEPLANWHDGILKVDAALSALAVGGMAYSIYKFGEFEDVMLAVKGIIRASDTDYIRLNELVKGLGATTRYTATEAAEGLRFLAMAGLDVEEAIGALPNMLNLAQAAAINLGEAADISTNIMTGYGASVDDLTRINDVLTATFTNSNTNLLELGQAFKYAGPVAKALGFDIEEVAATFGVLANAGYKADMAGTALRNIMVALVKPAGNMGKLFNKLGIDTSEMGVNLASSSNALRSLGVSVKDADGNMRPLTDILAQLQRGLERIPDKADRTAVLMEIFGKRGGPQMAALLEQGVTAISGMESKIRSLGGVTDDIAKQMESGIGGTIRLIRSSVEAVTIEIGERIAAGAIPAGQGMAELIRAINSEIRAGSFDEIFNAIESFGVDLEAVFIAVAANLPTALDRVDFSRFVGAIQAVVAETGNLFKAFFGEIDLTTPEGLAAAIQKIVNAGTKLAEVSEGIIEHWERWSRWLGEIVERLGEMDKETANTIGNMLGLGKELNVVSRIAENFNTALGGLNRLLTLTLVRQTYAFVSSIKLTGTALTSLATSVSTAIGSAAGQVGLLGLAAVAGWTAGTLINDHVPAVGRAAQAVIGWADDLLDFSGKQERARKETEIFDRLINTLAETTDDYTYDLSKLRAELLGLGYDITDLPDAKIIKLAADADILSFEDAQQLIHARVPNSREVEIYVNSQRAAADLSTFGEDADEAARARTLALTVATDGQSVTATNRVIDDLENRTANPSPYVLTIRGDGSIEIVRNQLASLPSDKTVKVKTELDELETKRFEAQLSVVDALTKGYFETIQSQVEWEAKLEIAEVEANAAKIEAIMSALTAAFSSSGEILSTALGAFAEMSASNPLWISMQEFIEREFAIREETLELTRETAAAEIDLMRARQAAYERGDAQVQIDGTGLQPHLEAFMFEILSAIQVRANAEGADFLVGLAT